MLIRKGRIIKKENKEIAGVIGDKLKMKLILPKMENAKEKKAGLIL